MYECIPCRVASFEPTSRVIEVLENVRNKSQVTFIQTIKNKIGLRETNPQINRTVVKFALKRSQINLVGNERIELRFMRVDNKNSKI